MMIWLQFLLIPIRDWNENLVLHLLLFGGLQFLLIPIRDWNSKKFRNNTTNFIKIAISLNPY